MKRLQITETITHNVDLDDIQLSNVSALITEKERKKYTNIRFLTDTEGDYEDANQVIRIIGDRLETIEEAKKRIDLKNKEKEKKLTAKMTKDESEERVSWWREHPWDCGLTLYGSTCYNKVRKELGIPKDKWGLIGKKVK